jgi:hypothetical protein
MPYEILSKRGQESQIPVALRAINCGTLLIRLKVTRKGEVLNLVELILTLYHIILHYGTVYKPLAYGQISWLPF